MKKVLVTTASLGQVPLRSYWAVQESEKYEIHYRRYTNANFPSRHNSMHPRLNAKIARMLSHELHPGYDYYIWMDSTFEMHRKDAVEKIVDYCGTSDLCVFRHPLNANIREELAEVHAYMADSNNYIINRYGGERIDEQVDYYLSDPEFEDDLLIATGAFVYSANLVYNRYMNLMREWFHHNCFWSVQDQLSFPYVLKEFNPDWKLFETGIYDNPYLQFNNALVSII